MTTNKYKKIIIFSLFSFILLSFSNFSFASTYPASCSETAQGIINAVGGCVAIDCNTYSNICAKCCVQTPSQSSQTCSFSYSNWSTCSSNSQQTRTVASKSPSGCTGGSPVTSQSCSYAPITCISFSYSDWGSCQSNGSQTRNVTDSSPFSCNGGSPVTSQTCSYVAPVLACISFIYSNWSVCQSNNTQSRTVASKSPSGCTGGSPVLSQSCSYVASTLTCTSFIYSAWTPSTCPASGQQTRTVASSSPTGCIGGSSVIGRSCNYIPPTPKSIPSPTPALKPVVVPTLIPTSQTEGTNPFTNSNDLRGWQPPASSVIATTSTFTENETVTPNPIEAATQISPPKSFAGFIEFVLNIFAGFFKFFGFGK